MKMFNDLTFIEGESKSFMVELFSSTTIMAYSTSSPLCSKRNIEIQLVSSMKYNVTFIKTTLTKLALIKRVGREFLQI